MEVGNNPGDITKYDHSPKIGNTVGTPNIFRYLAICVIQGHDHEGKCKVHYFIGKIN